MKLKTLYVFLIFLTNTTVFSQTKNQYAKAKISYGISIDIDFKAADKKHIAEYFPDLAPKIKTIDSEFDFSLVFNDSTSIFYLEKKLFSDESAASLAISFTDYFGRIKQQTNHYITEELQESFGKFLVSRPYQEWELQEENKMIGDYLCFKATTFYTVTNPKGKVFKHDFTAWYTPQLPYKYGPAGFGNLPGLIIELQGKNYSYGVQKIEFYDVIESKENEMPELKKKKLITEEEFEELAAKDEKRWREKQDN